MAVSVWAWPHSIARAGPSFISVIYVESNTGDSSGGHAAVRIGDDCFHFQHSPEGLVLLEKEGWEDFRFYYNDLGNRDIYLAEIALQPGEAMAIWQEFMRLRLCQEQQAAKVRDLEGYSRLAAKLLNGSGRIPVRGAGLFSERRSPFTGSIMGEISRRYGKGFLAVQKASLLKDIVEMHAEASHKAPDLAEMLAALQDRFELLTALDVLENGYDLAMSALSDPEDEAIPRLSPDEAGSVKRWKDFFLNSVVSMLSSPRSDRGFPIMLATARFLCACKSLETGRLLLLKPAPVPGQEIDIAEAGGLAVVRELYRVKRQELKRAAQTVLRVDVREEPAWNMLENIAAQANELSAAAGGHRVISNYSGSSIPEAAANVILDAAAGAAVPRNAVSIIQGMKTELRDAMKERWSYSLVARNCVTELFRVIARGLARYEAVAEAQGQKDGIGARLRLHSTDFDSFSFVPWIMFRQACSRLRPVNVTHLPSYRHRLLAALYEQDNSFVMHLLENNTLTSRTYRYGRHSSAFLFFTDDLLALRPVCGALNLVWAACRAGAGVVTAPFDYGRLFESGLRGALFSLPELMFVNIRKGDYAFVPFRFRDSIDE